MDCKVIELLMKKRLISWTHLLCILVQDKDWQKEVEVILYLMWTVVNSPL